MSGTQQPEALRLADKYEVEGFLQDHRFAQEHWCRQAAAELRRQHARIAELEDATDIAIERIAELEEQLSAIGAGGVEPLRKAAATPIAWYVTGCSTMRCGGSAKAVPLYTVPRGTPPPSQQRRRWIHTKTATPFSSWQAGMDATKA